MSELIKLFRARRVRDIGPWLARHIPRADDDRFSLIISFGEECRVAVPSADERIYGLGCLQDVMLAVFAVVLEEEGVLSLEDCLADYLPGFLADKSEAPVRLYHLLSRSTGIWLPSAANCDAPITGWDGFSEYIGKAVPRFQPGETAAHSLLDRIVLIEVLRRVLKSDPYEVLRETFWLGPSSIQFRPVTGHFIGCYKEVAGSLSDVARFLERSLKTSWVERLEDKTGASYAAPNRPTKDWAPKWASHGLYRMENRLWGQDGDDPNSGHLALRIDPISRCAVVGRFASALERDFLLALLCSDLAGLAKPTRDFRVGTLADFSRDELSGQYEGTFGHWLTLAFDGDRMLLASSVTGDGFLPLNVNADGQLTARWAGQSLWFEPLALASGQLAVHFGRQLYLKMPGLHA